jgi:hypothetical protein
MKNKQVNFDARYTAKESTKKVAPTAGALGALALGIGTHAQYRGAENLWQGTNGTGVLKRSIHLVPKDLLFLNNKDKAPYVSKAERVKTFAPVLEEQKKLAAELKGKTLAEVTAKAKLDTAKQEMNALTQGGAGDKSLVKAASEKVKAAEAELKEAVKAKSKVSTAVKKNAAKYRNAMKAADFASASGKLRELGKAAGRAVKHPIGLVTLATLGLGGAMTASAGAYDGYRSGKERQKLNEGTGKTAVSPDRYYIVKTDRSGKMTLVTSKPYMTRISANSDAKNVADKLPRGASVSVRSGKALLEYHGEHFYLK